MKPSEALRFHRDAIRRVVEQNHGRNPRVFGSVLRGEDNEASDLDLLVDPTPDTTLLDIARIQGRLQKLLGVTVDGDPESTARKLPGSGFLGSHAGMSKDPLHRSDYLGHILQAIQRIRHYTEDLTEAAFRESELVQDAGSATSKSLARRPGMSNATILTSPGGIQTFPGKIST